MHVADVSLAAWKRVAVALPQALQGYAREWGESLERMVRSNDDRSIDLEWRLWRSLCEALEEAGAVTKEDLSSPMSAEKTAGQRLLRDLRAWGNQRTQLAAVLPARAVSHARANKRRPYARR